MAVPVADVIHNKQMRKGGENDGGAIFAISRYAGQSLPLFPLHISLINIRRSHIKQGSTLLRGAT